MTTSAANRSSNGTVPFPPSKDATKEEHKTWVDAVEAALDRAKKSTVGLQGATERACENTSADVQAAKDSNFAEESMQKLHASWDSFASHCLPIAEGYNEVQEKTADMLNRHRIKLLSESALESTDTTRNAREDSKEDTNEAKNSTTKAIGGAVNSAYKWTVETAVPVVSEKAGLVARHFAPARSKSGPESAGDVEADDQNVTENNAAKGIGAAVVDKATGLLSGVSEWAGKNWQNLNESGAVHATCNAAIKNLKDTEGEGTNEEEPSGDDAAPESGQEKTSKNSTAKAIGGTVNSAYKWTVETAIPAVSEKAGQVAHHFAPPRSKSEPQSADDVEHGKEKEQSGANAASKSELDGEAKNSATNAVGGAMDAAYKWTVEAAVPAASEKADRAPTCAPSVLSKYRSKSANDFPHMISA